MPVLRQLRHPLWAPQAPKGFRRLDAGLGGPRFAAQSRRARAHARRRLRVERVEPRALLDVVDVPPRILLRCCSDTSIAGRRSHRARHRGTGFPVEMIMDRRTFVRHMCLGGIATFGAAARHLRAGAAGRPLRVRAAAWRLRRPCRGRPVRRSAIASLRGALAFEESDLFRSTTSSASRPALRLARAVAGQTNWSSLHAMAIPYRTRSHFDGQAILETGIDRPVGSADGWLNRLLQVMPGERAGIAIASGLPRSHDRHLRRADVVAHPARRRRRRLSRAARAALPRDSALHGRFEAAMQQQDDRRRRADGAARTRGAAASRR